MSTSMDNLSSGAHTNRTSSSSIEVTAAIMSCDALNIVVLTYGLRQMYLGIEISHPVYATLFCNLMSVLAASIIEMISLPFLNGSIRAETFAKSCAAFYALFHNCSWLVMAILRYLYIVNSHWIHQNFPDPKRLTAISIFAIYGIYILNLSSTIPLLVVNGWPYIELSKMSDEARKVCGLPVLVNYLSIICLSCIFYILILHQRGGIGKNSVGIAAAAAAEQGQESSKDNSQQVILQHFVERSKTQARKAADVIPEMDSKGQPEVNLRAAVADVNESMRHLSSVDHDLIRIVPDTDDDGVIRVREPNDESRQDGEAGMANCKPDQGSPHAAAAADDDVSRDTHVHVSNVPNRNDLILECSSFEQEMMKQEEAKALLQRESEIDAAVRCLRTNLVLSFLFALFYSLYSTINGAPIL